MPKRYRVSFYIDGFNVYHRLKGYQKKTGKCYNWLDYKSLCNSLLKEDEQLGDVYFFTAISKDFGQETVRRHNQYITALELTGVKVVMGYFSKKKRKCRGKGCRYDGERRFYDREEKQTDVNISLQLLKDAVQDRYDKCFLVSGDGDFAPVLTTVMNLFPKKQAGVITPPFEEGTVKLAPMTRLKRAAYHDKKINKRLIINLKFDMLNGHSLPEEIKISGKPSLKMPNGYQTF
jgi:uncharacterized LabA/DUF88 family protein